MSTLETRRRALTDRRWIWLIALGLIACIDQPTDRPAADPDQVVLQPDGGLPVRDGRPPIGDGGPLDRGRPGGDARLRDAEPVDAERPPDGCRSPGPAIERTVQVPLGETVFFTGDDLLFFWGVSHPCPPVVASRPRGATAAIVEGARLSPDRVGDWVITRGDDRVVLEVRDDLLDEDTFLNFNYAPTAPLAVTDPDQIWVASPPSNAVQQVLITPDGAERGALVPTGSWPGAVAWWAERRLLLVAQTGRDSLGFVDVDAARLVDAIEVGDEPAAVVVDTTDPRNPVAWVAVSGSGEVVRVDLERLVVTHRIEAGPDPRALVLDGPGGRLYAASLLSSNAHPQGQVQREPPPAETRRDIAVIDTRSADRVGYIPEVGTLLRGIWLDPDNADRLLVSLSHARNQQATIQAASRPQAHGLAEVTVDRARPDRSAVRQIDLDRQPGSRGPAPSPYSMLATPGRLLVVSLSAGRRLLVLDRDDLTEINRLTTGHDPRGLAIAGRRLWTFSWLDETLQGWPLDRLDRSPAPVEVRVGSDPTPQRIREGQRIFNDATFSARRDFSCNNCHPDGLVDGMVWNLLLDGDVNTLPFRNVGGTDPFLWGGQLPTLFDFSREVLRLVGASATGEQMELLTEYMQSVTAPPNPHTLPGGRLTPAGERGKALYEGAAGCVACHGGPLLTNRETVRGKTPNLNTDVPSLIGVYDTGPWGREGQWYRLEDMVDFAVEFTGARLTAEQRADLTTYVRQLPGDRLYLNGARPLIGARSVWHLTPIDLTFSSVLATGQADAFALEARRGGDWRPVGGQWTVAGRHARYRGEPLDFDTEYRITIAAGLEGALGYRLPDRVVVPFSTGGIPELDTTGRWEWQIRGGVAGTVIVALLQASGGHVSGALIDGDGVVDLDHLEGFVSGRTLFIDPYPVISPFGDVVVESTEIDLVDDDGDGIADRGDGIIVTPFVELTVQATRVGP